MSNSEFLKVLIESILEGSNIPKVQVERAIGPILGIFLPDILNEMCSKDPDSNFEMILPEFPLKKANNQSTNIDYLLINENEKKIILFELKTDRSSFNMDQMEIYSTLKHKIEKQTAYFLIEDLESIMKASQKSYKYQYVLDQCEAHRDLFMEITKADIIYLAPQQTMSECDNKDIQIFSFGDLPEDINNSFQMEWRTIRNSLIKLDSHTDIQSIDQSVESTIIQNIRSFINEEQIITSPVYVYIGKSGRERKRPNYQVEFSDGSIKTFYYSGKRHQTSRFNEKNLNSKIAWKDFAGNNL